MIINLHKVLFFNKNLLALQKLNEDEESIDTGALL